MEKKATTAQVLGPLGVELVLAAGVSDDVSLVRENCGVEF